MIGKKSSIISMSSGLVGRFRTTLKSTYFASIFWRLGNVHFVPEAEILFESAMPLQRQRSVKSALRRFCVMTSANSRFSL
jgi:hypothetical protein